MAVHVHTWRKTGLKADDGFAYLDHCECGEVVETPRCNNWFEAHWCERNPEHDGWHRCGDLECVVIWIDEQGNWLYE